MSVPGTTMNLVRSASELAGYQLVVELSEHSIEIELERPDEDKRAWDPSLYKSGNVFLQGYANPIKPRVVANESLEDHDTAYVEEGEGDTEEGEESASDEPDRHAAVISSSRFKTYMKQDLISQMLTPQQKWKQIIYILIGFGALLLINVLVSASAAGVY